MSPLVYGPTQASLKIVQAAVDAVFLIFYKGLNIQVHDIYPLML